MRIGAPFAEHIFSRFQRSSALKSVPGVPLRSTPGFSLVAAERLDNKFGDASNIRVRRRAGFVRRKGMA
jgi:hypothetical protein